VPKWNQTFVQERSPQASAATAWQVTNMIDVRRTHRKMPPKRRHLLIVEAMVGGHNEMRPPAFLTFLLGQ
jgi:hypothetical protein